MKKNLSPFNKNIKHGLTHFSLALIGLFCILPIILIGIISLKSRMDIHRKPPVLFPCDTPTKSFDIRACRWSLEGYQLALGMRPDPDALLGFRLTGNIVRIYLFNTFLYATAASLLVVGLAGAAGYAFSRYRFRGHKVLLTAILAITGVPFLTNLVGLYQMGISIRKSALPIDDRVFLVLVYVGLFLPLSAWIAKGFFDAIPRDMEEAALIDGCSPFQSLILVVTPIAAPGMIAIFLLTFVNVWNEFMAGYLLVAKNEYKPVMFGLYDFMGQNTLNLQVVAAACIIIALPVILLFLLFRDRFFSAMVEGSIKG
ncbi:MAG: carbohydrate ABC transporter permease [Anaerolineaceae bacterium]|nr:carbohydrate ABC transporter permease [Anaerolineaceae bacterium]